MKWALAKSLNNTLGYIDDVCPINDNGNFVKFNDQIYPSDLIFSKENVGTLSATVLDLNISIMYYKW